jgi:hypothetical protein
MIRNEQEKMSPYHQLYPALLTVCNKANKPVYNKANKPVCKRVLTHHQIYQAQKQQSLNQSLLHNTGNKSKSKSKSN